MIAATSPRNIYIGITDKCNARCIMCWRQFIAPPYKDMDLALIKQLYSDSILKNALMIGWWGDGELFAHDNIEYIIEIMQSLPLVQHTLSTNGSMLSKYAAALSLCNITHIQISLDGSTDETFERIRRGIKLPAVIQGIKDVEEAFLGECRKPPDITFLFVAMRSNIAELPGVVRLAAELNVTKVFVNALVVHNPELLVEQFDLSALDLVKDYYNQAKTIGEVLGVEVSHCTPDKII